MEHQEKIAFVFPGQGSQSVGMLNSFKDIPLVDEILREADDVLGYRLSDLIAQGPSEELSLTVNTQPALLTASYAMYSYWRSLGGRKPDLMAGHSLGEYSALVCADALNFEEGLRLVRFRAERMQEAVPSGKGAMAAVLGLPDEEVIRLCREAGLGGEVAEAVNFNTPGQVVIAGTKAGVAKASELCKANGAKRVLALNVSGPFHSSLMKPAADKLAERLQSVDFTPTEIDLIHNVDVSVRKSSEEIRDALARQVDSPVLWAPTIRDLAQRGVTKIYECGPGSVLTGMVKRIVSGVSAQSLNNKEAIEAAAQENS